MCRKHVIHKQLNWMDELSLHTNTAGSPRDFSSWKLCSTWGENQQQSAFFSIFDKRQLGRYEIPNVAFYVKKGFFNLHKKNTKKNPKTSTPIFLGLLNKGAQSKPFVKKKTVLMCLKSAEALKQPSTSLHHKKAHGVSFHPVLSPQSASAVEPSSVSHNLGKKSMSGAPILELKVGSPSFQGRRYKSLPPPQWDKSLIGKEEKSHFHVSLTLSTLKDKICHF